MLICIFYRDTDSLSTLEFALKAAGLFDVFATVPLGFTVLAPSDDAFAELKAYDTTFYEALLTAPWILHLQWLLLAHVVSISCCVMANRLRAERISLTNSL